MLSKPLGFVETTIGKKVVMAVTGFIVIGFVVAHMVGNLQIFMGPEKLNGYAAFLRGLGGGLWVFRIVIALSAVLHIVSAAQVTLASLKARPVGYKVNKFLESSYAARTMRWGGPILLLFVVYHLLHFTIGSAHPSAGLGSAHPNGAGFDATDVYNNVVVGFQVWWVSAVYIAAMILLGLHILHGAFSMFQSVGLNHPKWNLWRVVIAVVLAGAVTIGNISMPAAVLLGFLNPVY